MVLQQKSQPPSTAESRTRSKSPRVERGWTALGMFGLLLAFLGLLDAVLYVIPPAFASPEWEFGTVAAVISSLPLATIGLAGVVGWLLVQGGRVQRAVAATALVGLSLCVGAALTLFLLNVPLALRVADGPQGPAIYRSIVRTLSMGFGFGLAYLVAAFILVRRSRWEGPNG